MAPEPGAYRFGISCQGTDSCQSNMPGTIIYIAPSHSFNARTRTISMSWLYNATILKIDLLPTSIRVKKCNFRRPFPCRAILPGVSNPIMFVAGRWNYSQLGWTHEVLGMSWRFLARWQVLGSLFHPVLRILRTTLTGLPQNVCFRPFKPRINPPTPTQISPLRLIACSANDVISP